MTNIAAASTSPKMSGISSASRSYLQITHTRRPDGISASIRYEPSRRGSRWIIRLYAASTSSADRACAAIFSRFHSIHLNRRMRAAYQRGQASIQRDAGGCTRLGRHTHKAGARRLWLWASCCRTAAISGSRPWTFYQGRLYRESAASLCSPFSSDSPGAGIPRSRQIFFTRLSGISRCRGTADR